MLKKKLLVTVFIHHTCDKITVREVSRMIGIIKKKHKEIQKKHTNTHKNINTYTY